MAQNYVCVSFRGEILESREASPNQPSHGRQKVGSAKAGSLVHLERNTMGSLRVWKRPGQAKLRKGSDRQSGEKLVEPRN